MLGVVARGWRVGGAWVGGGELKTWSAGIVSYNVVVEEVEECVRRSRAASSDCVWDSADVGRSLSTRESLQLLRDWCLNGLNYSSANGYASERASPSITSARGADARQIAILSELSSLYGSKREEFAPVELNS